MHETLDEMNFVKFEQFFQFSSMTPISLAFYHMHGYQKYFSLKKKQIASLQT